MRPDRPPVRPGRSLGRLVMWASAYDEKVLRKAPRERKLAVCTGSAVLVTATMAGVSMLFALHMSRPADLWFGFYVVFALFYAVAILSIDRFFVALQLRPFHFAPSDPEAPVQQPGPWRVLAAGTPRLVFSVLMGLVIAEPLLLAIFSTEIDQRVSQMQVQLVKEATEAAHTAAAEENDSQPPRTAHSERLEELRVTEIPDAQASLRTLQQDLRREEELARSEADGAQVDLGSGSTSGVPGCEGRCREHQAKARILSGQVRDKQDELTTLKDEEARLEQVAGPGDQRRQEADEARRHRQEAELRDAQERARSTDGLLIRVSALEKLARDETPFATGEGAASEDTKTEMFLGLSAVGVASWLLRLWLVLLDCLPMIFKIMLALRPRRTYDMLLAENEERKRCEAQARVDGARALQQVVSTSAHEAASTCLQERGGVWIDTDAGRILIGANGSAFVPREFLTAVVMAPNGHSPDGLTDGLQVDLGENGSRVTTGSGPHSPDGPPPRHGFGPRTHDRERQVWQ